jgi:hypothetical protein
VQYLLKNNWTPCVEFEFPANSTCAPAYASGVDSSASACYYTNRYWSMWKLPMYGATDADSVLAECKKAAKAFPNAFVRLAGFDANKQARARRRPPACLLACACDARARHALGRPARRRAPLGNPTIDLTRFSACSLSLATHRCRWCPSLCTARLAARRWRRLPAPSRVKRLLLLLLLLRSRTRAGARQHPRERAARCSAADALLHHLCSYAFWFYGIKPHSPRDA